MKGMHLPDNKLMREFIKKHFPKATFTIAKDDPEFEIVKHLRSLSENTLVVLGAYQRNDLSPWFKTTMADVLMKEIEKPLFLSQTK